MWREIIKLKRVEETRLKMFQQPVDVLAQETNDRKGRNSVRKEEKEKGLEKRNIERKKEEREGQKKFHVL